MDGRISVSQVRETVATMTAMAVYALTIFAGAFLLFQVQPLIGKYILPWFGGAPAVWTTCMLFFQVVLLAGYGYAHLLSTRLKPRWQAATHLCLTVAALCCLPAIPSEAWKPSAGVDPTWRIIGLLSATIGLPYLVLSATSPLLQHWFSRTNSSKSPYRLYALSNVGSLLALATYPTLFETHFTRLSQAGIWAWGLVAYGVGLGLCAWKLWARGTEAQNSPPNPGHSTNLRSKSPLTPALLTSGGRTQRNQQGFSAVSKPAEVEAWSGQSVEAGSEVALCSGGEARELRGFDCRSILWIALPACASALLLATTNKMCQEVAVVPFLWVVPLGLYLLSFVICFDNSRWYRRFPFGLSLIAVMGAVCWALFHTYDISVRKQMWIYGATCFICCMVCHGEVYRLKPGPKGLTSFYLMISLGGALGGLFVGIVAPMIFSDYFELQWGLGLCGLLFVLLVSQDWRSGRLQSWRWKLAGIPSWGALASWGLVLAWVGMIAAFWALAHQPGPHILSKTRNFYGVLTVFERSEPGSDTRVANLVHGRTAHGIQIMDPARASWPTMYYSERSGVGLALQQLPPGARRIGLVGLGTGTLATYAQPGDYLRIYEINPSVVRLAQSYFSYLRNCHAQTEIVLGDARLSLEKEWPQRFDLLVLDAFTSDAIPVHLLTEQAFQLYQRHLKSSGILAVHVSNLSLDLEPVVANAAAKLGYVAIMVDYRPPRENWWVTRSKWVLLSKGETGVRLGRCCRDARPALADLARVPLWTDDFTSLFQILWRASAQEALPVTAEVELQSALQLERGNVTGAIEHYRAALESEPDLAIALNNLAWILATNPDASLRNGAEAVKYARRACELTNSRTTILVGTLAAAYAEAGQFAEAISTAEKACHLASTGGDTMLLMRNQQLLEQYRLGKPARD